jgi:hypothetical protein
MYERYYYIQNCNETTGKQKEEASYNRRFNNTKKNYIIKLMSIINKIYNYYKEFQQQNKVEKKSPRRQQVAQKL